MHVDGTVTQKSGTQYSGDTVPKWHSPDVGQHQHIGLTEVVWQWEGQHTRQLALGPS